jgi:chromosome segregation ATPase
MATDIDDLSTLESDRLDAAQAAVQTARERLGDLRTQYEEAEQEIERLTEQVDTLRLDVASGEATEEELTEAKADLKEAKARREELAEEIEEQEATVPRLEERVKSVREELAVDLAEEYSSAAQAILKQKAKAMKQLATALDKAEAFQQKAQENGLRKDERLVKVNGAVRAAGGNRVQAESLRYRAEKIQDRKIE